MLRLEVEKFTPLRHPGCSGNVGVCPRFPIRNPSKRIPDPLLEICSYKSERNGEYSMSPGRNIFTRYDFHIKYDYFNGTTLCVMRDSRALRI